MPHLTCSELFNCCDCGGHDCGCRYCWTCNACDTCLTTEDGTCEADPGN